MKNNQKEAIKYLKALMPDTTSKESYEVNSDRDVLEDFIKYPKETCLFSRYQKNIYMDLIKMYNLPPIKLADYSDTTWILA